jgi:hypothetical protein
MDARESIARRMAENELLATLKRRANAIQRHSVEETTVKEWLAIRKEAGLRIDPETAEVTWIYAEEVDPYGVHPDLPEEWSSVSRKTFARSPGSNVWVYFGDLPAATRDAFEKRWQALIEAEKATHASRSPDVADPGYPVDRVPEGADWRGRRRDGQGEDIR